MSEEKKYDIWGNEVTDDSEFVEVELAPDAEELAGEPVMAQPTEQVEEAAPEENPYAGAVIEENPYAQSSTDNQSVYGTPYNGYGMRNEGNTQNFYRFSSGSSGNPPEYEEEKKPKKSRKKWIVGGICGVLLLGLLGSGVYTFAKYVDRKFDYYSNEIAKAEEQAQSNPTAETLPQNGLTKSELTGVSEISGTQASVLDVSGVVDQVMPSVVCLTVNLEYQTNNFFYGSTTQSSSASGSGVIIGESEDELLIVTNNHVIDEEQNAYYYTVNTTAMVVTFCDGSTAEAYVKGTDPERDLAVIAISMDDLSEETKNAISVAKIGDSDAAKVGNGVIAIGNALGYGQSCTVGYISALNRDVTFSDGNTRTLMQVDAAINPGNSGGGLFDVYGNLIGINESKNVSENTESMGYAIPISSVEDVITELMNIVPRTVYNDEEKGYLGIQGGDVPSAYVNAGYPAGAVVLQVFENGAAANSGLQIQDIITKINDTEISSMTELMTELAYYQSGETVTLEVERIEGNQFNTVQVEVTLGEKSTIPQESNTRSGSSGTGNLLP